ncbi:MAG: serine/threonine protein phosphatase [Cytophagales bacterium]|nr:serine/threonine protein phosphatase [Armatimonadota bacterium]
MASVWAIGDIHGKAAMLGALLDALPRQSSDTTVFLGDYIDRGEDSAGAVRRALAEYDAAPDRTVLLWGNHEDMAATHFNFAAPSDFVYDPYDWFRNGGIAAMESWGYEKPALFVASCPPDLKRLFPLLQPFWRASQDQFPELAHCLWVHAGLRKGQQPEDSTGEVLLWIREEFLDALDPSGRFVIHGHTPMRAVRALPDKVGIDTGAVFGGPLTALQMPERRIFQVDAEGHATDFLLEPVG